MRTILLFAACIVASCGYELPQVDIPSMPKSQQENAGLSQTDTRLVLRHLPGTIIRPLGKAEVYMVTREGVIGRIVDWPAAERVGYRASQQVTAAPEEMACYGRAKDIRSFSPPKNGAYRDGMLIKESGSSTTYAISGNVAWPIRTWETFMLAGYESTNVMEIPAGLLAGHVKAVGDCIVGAFCLDDDYLSTCGRSESEDDGADPMLVPAVVTQKPDAAPPPEDDEEVIVVIPDASVPDVRTAAVKKPDMASPSDMMIISKPVDEPIGPDLSWVYSGEGSKLCLNGWYASGGPRMVLLVWTGPGADATRGPVAIEREHRYCWDFGSREAGLYSFWADAADPACAEWICPPDKLAGNGAQYQTAPNAASKSRKWLHCEPTGCDGSAYFDGSSWFPQGNQ